MAGRVSDVQARRQWLRVAGVTGLAGLAGWLPGCVASSRGGRAAAGHTAPIYPPSYQAPRAAAQTHPRPAPTHTASTMPTPQPLRLHVIPRTAWTRAPVGQNINPLGRVTRLTVHHAGGNPVWATDASSTYATLESIRTGHRKQGWADIGYHFIVDRDGRVLEGRNLRYQGAHVSEQNENNLGVMVLGNFERQSPSPRQVQSVNATLNALCAAYSLPVHRVFTHRELGRTACPGRNLQAHMDAIRHKAVLARG